jgi:flagellar hook assembly protein FlgD
MSEKLNSNHEFLDIDYENVTMNEIIKFKKSLLAVLNVIERWETPQTYTNTSAFDNFITATTVAYGYALNPYKDVLNDINEMKQHLEAVNKQISEYWILDNIHFIGKKQKFNKDLILGGYNKSVENWLKIVNKFDNAILLFNRALKDKNNILKKVMRYDSSINKVDGFYKQYSDGNVEVIEYVDNGSLNVRNYHFGSNDWLVYHSTDTIEFDKTDKQYEKIWKAECPELYII